MRTIGLCCCAFGVFASITLAACSSRGLPATPSSNNAFGNVGARTATAGIDRPYSAGSYLYAAAYGGDDGACKSSTGCIVEYAEGVSQPVRTVRDKIVNPRAIALDGSDNLYSVNRDDVTVYAPGRSKVLFSLRGVSIPYSVTTDGMSSVYVADRTATRKGGLIAVFGSGAAGVKRYISDGIDDPLTLGFHSGDLYVGNAVGSVTEYTASGSSPIRIIKSGVHHPRAFAFDRSGNLYVANGLIHATSKHTGSVAIYAPGSTVPLRIVRNGIDDPLALAMGATGNLFVANFEANTVTVYAPGSSSISRTLKTEYPPRALAIGPNGDVYVGETQLIEVFAPGGTVPARSIDQGGWVLTWGGK
jgi:hypothetical protein